MTMPKNPDCDECINCEVCDEHERGILPEWQPSGCDDCDRIMKPKCETKPKTSKCANCKSLRELNTKLMKELSEAKKFITDTQAIVFAIMSDEELFALASKKLTENKNMGFELGAKTI